MNGRILLDTNIIIALFAGEKNVLTELENSTEVFVPAVVLGELFYGAQNSERKEMNLATIWNFTKSVSVMNCDNETAFNYGKIKQQLKLKGTPIPENDIWIGALAKQNQITLITRDKHFKLIPGILVAEW